MMVPEIGAIMGKSMIRFRQAVRVLWHLLERLIRLFELLSRVVPEPAF